MIVRNNDKLFKTLTEFISGAQELTIIVPYIKSNALLSILKDNKNCKQIVVRWEPKDIIVGVSDLEIFELCQEKGISLFWNKRIHLKVYLNDFKSVSLTSANISKRALGFDFDKTCNHEVGTIINNLSVNDKVYFQQIINESIHITSEIYDSLKLQLQDIKAEDIPNNFIENWETLNQEFLISSLPMSYDIKTLKDFYFKREELSELETNCAIHDIVLYQIPNDLSELEFDTHLQYKFQNHPFIKAFLEEVENHSEGIYFGTVKEWFKNNTTTVPIPRRYELTENTQILYRWILKLSNNKYVVDRPRHSERIRKII